ncbi:MAG: MBL fold metallo-hydrolase [Pirellulales bacterium]|nr:MBL fold metallo-hydrolase [Pirellulales bacterium]
MQFHCLGTVGYHPNSTRHTSCYFLPAAGIVLDAGTGMFRLAPLIQTPTLDILLSHAHLDHTYGLTFLLDVLYQRPVDQLRIWGEAAKLAAVRDHLFDPLLFPVPLENVQWMEIDGLSEFHIGDVALSWRPQQHPGGSVAYRLDWAKAAKRLVYATDTAGDLSAEHADWSERADLLIHECYFRDQAAQWALRTGHSWTSRVAEVAELSRPEKLLLTHINPLEEAEDPVGIDSIRRGLPGEVFLARDGLRVDF